MCYSDPIIGFGKDKLRPWGIPVVIRVREKPQKRNMRKKDFETFRRKFT
jgi:hypothetical protein